MQARPFLGRRPQTALYGSRTMARNGCQRPGCERPGKARFMVERNQKLSLYLCDTCFNLLHGYQVRDLFHRFGSPSKSQARPN